MGGPIGETATLLQDDFGGPNGSLADSAIWQPNIGDGSFLGRTQMRPDLPTVSDGALQLELDTFNPTNDPHFPPAFQGSEIISNLSFSPSFSDGGIAFEARARLVVPVGGIVGGMVGGIFTYNFNAATHLHDENDFELLSNEAKAVGEDHAQTNIYRNENLGAGDPISFPVEDHTSFHTYRMEWLPDRVRWLIDGQVVREDISQISQQPMQFHLNFWAPSGPTQNDPGWPEAFDPLLQPVTDSGNNTSFFFDVDWAHVAQLSTIYGSSGDDSLFGTAAADWIDGQGGDDRLDGGAGYDTAVFAGNQASYTITHADLTVTVSGPDGTDTLTGIEVVQFADTSVSLAVHQFDFDGDGMADVLFNATNSDYLWMMNDRAIGSQGGVDLFDPNFSVQVTGDFDGDGMSDVLFENPATGGVYEWQLNGTTIVNQGAVDVGDTSFHILGTADFNGDGMSDVLWRSTAGYVYEWLMNGKADTGAPVGALDPSWHVVGAGDFNGDGMADILLRNISAVPNQNGAFYLWEMNGKNIIGQGGIERPGTDWVTLGTGDFNGDGKTDFAVRHVSNFQPGEAHGAVWVYLMNGTTIASQGAAGIADAATWHVQEIADLNGDGRDDILFRNDAGYFYSWDMNGTHIASEGLAGTEAGNWADPSLHVVGQHWDLV